MAYVIWLEQCTAEALDQVGGKCANLGSLLASGAPVPPGFAVTVEAWRRALSEEGLQVRIEAELRPFKTSADPMLDEVSQRVRALIEHTRLAPSVEEEIRAALKELRQRCGAGELAVAVRSSATAEDLPNASFAGLHDTALWIVGESEVLGHVRRCWSSLYTARAIAYRIDKGLPHDRVLMAVLVQQMVNAKAAGVAFTLNPINGDRSKVAIDSSFGLGEAVVSGEVTPDNFLVDKVIFEVVKRVISDKRFEYVFDPEAGAVKKREIETVRRSRPSLSLEEIIAVARMAKSAEAHFRSPQDIEWAIDAAAQEGRSIMLLQSRPETVWSQRPRAPATMEDSRGMAGLVKTLIRGVKVETRRDPPEKG